MKEISQRDWHQLPAEEAARLLESEPATGLADEKVMGAPSQTSAAFTVTVAHRFRARADHRIESDTLERLRTWVDRWYRL